jgi:hypothetical protein
MALESSPEKLAVGATLKTAFKAVFGNRGPITRATLLPLAISLLLSSLTLALLAEKPKDDLPSYTIIALLALQLVPLALFAGAVSRRLLANHAARSTLFSWLGVQPFYVVCFAIFFVVVSLPFGFGFIGLLPMILMRPEFAIKFGLLIPLHLLLPWHLYLFPFHRPGVLIDMHVVTHFGHFLLPLSSFMTMAMVWTLPYYMLVLPFMARLSLVFPSRSLSTKLGPGESWRLTRGNGLRLCAVLLTIAVFSVLARSLFLAVVPRSVSFVNFIYEAVTGSSIARSRDGTFYWSYNAFIHVGEFLLLYLGIALTVAALVSAYRQLSGRPPPTPC